MTLSRVAISLRQAAEAPAFILVLSVILPLLFGYVAGIPGGAGDGARHFHVLQANGAFAGGLGREPREIPVIMTLVEPGAVLGICDTFAMTSKRVRSFLGTIEKRMQNHPRASTGLFPCTAENRPIRQCRDSLDPPVESILFVTIGWIGVVIFVLALALGFIHLVF